VAENKKAPTKKGDGFSDRERAAMKERSQELKAERSKKKKDPEAEVLAKIAEMPEPDRSLGQRIHEIIKANGPDLVPRLWYGMPAYSKDGKVLCFFQGAQKFDTRYSTLGFNDVANLDDGAMWPTAYAITELNAAEETAIADLVKKAVG
jgi:uncharacterized protein YdhG (YjbR/CyaY superfamily)